MTHWHQWIFLVTSYKPKVNSGEISFISLRYWNLNTIYNLWTTNNILEMVESILTLWSGNGGLKCEQLVQGTHGEWQSPCGHTGPDTLPHAVLLIPENPSAHLIHMGPSTHPASKHYTERRASFLQTQWLDQGFLTPPGKAELFGLGREKLVFSPDVREIEQHVPGTAPHEGWWRGRGTSGGWHWGPYKDTRAPRGRRYSPVEKAWFSSVDGVTLRSRKHSILLFANMITPTDIFH